MGNGRTWTMVACGWACACACACGAADTRPTEVILSPVYGCDDTLDEATTIIVDVPEAGAARRFGTESAAQLLDAGPVFSDRSVRRRAALVCACRARKHRHAAANRDTEADILTWVGGIGLVGGSAVNGVAAATADGNTQKPLLAAGIITTAVGSAAFGMNQALGLAKRSIAHGAAAETQEMAAAILENDNADPVAWSRAWVACVESEGAESLQRLDRPQDAFGDSGPPRNDAALPAQPPAAAAPVQPSPAAAAAASAAEAASHAHTEGVDGGS